MKSGLFIIVFYLTLRHCSSSYSSKFLYFSFFLSALTRKRHWINHTGKGIFLWLAFLEKKSCCLKAKQTSFYRTENSLPWCLNSKQIHDNFSEYASLHNLSPAHKLIFYFQNQRPYLYLPFVKKGWESGEGQGGKRKN